MTPLATCRASICTNKIVVFEKNVAEVLLNLIDAQMK